MLRMGTRFGRVFAPRDTQPGRPANAARTHVRRGCCGVMPGRLAAALALLVAGVTVAAGQDAGVPDARRSFAPPGWEIGDCPPVYGTDAVLCAGTDTGPFKVDRHIPTMTIRAPAGTCAQAETYVLGRLSKFGMTVSRRSTGRCGPDAAPCTELRFKDPRPVDPLAPLAYVICPAGRPVQVVEYGVSAKSIDSFEPLARAQARWQPDR